MKIDKIIVSSNSSPLYLEFWPYVARAWKKLLGGKIDVILGYVGNEDVSGLEKHGTVIRFGTRTDIIDKNYSKLIRTIMATRYPDSYCLISDIDMLPLNGKYFINNADPATEDNIVFYSADQSGIPTKFPICYMLAKGRVFNEVINPQLLSEDDLLKYWGSVDRFLMKEERFSDETFYSELFGNWGILDKNAHRVVRLNRGWTHNMAHDRLDRAIWRIDYNKLNRGGYIDSHLLRPLTPNFNNIKPLFDYLGI